MRGLSIVALEGNKCRAHKNPLIESRHPSYTPCLLEWLRISVQISLVYKYPDKRHPSDPAPLHQEHTIHAPKGNGSNSPFRSWFCVGICAVEEMWSGRLTPKTWRTWVFAKHVSTQLCRCFERRASTVQPNFWEVARENELCMDTDLYVRIYHLYIQWCKSVPGTWNKVMETPINVCTFPLNVWQNDTES